MRWCLFSTFTLLVSGSLHVAARNHPDPDELADARLAVRWSQLAHDNAVALDPELTDPFPTARGWTMMHIAMHDALNAIVPSFEQYAFFGSDGSAHPIAAAAQAARDVLNHVYPARQAENDAELAFWLAGLPDDERKASGIRLGAASAAAIIEARADDRMLEAGEYAPQAPLEPGDYRFVPPLAFVYRPAFGKAAPFAIGSGAEFLPPPPPPLSSFVYAFSVNEVQVLGRQDSRFRSQDQTSIGAWWLEFNEFQWNRIMRQLAETRRLRLLDAARMFALANMAHVDATVAVWHAKQTHDFWRPIHAIRLAGTDGNPLTRADPEWLGEHVVPPLQEYPSAHAIQCQAIARTLHAVLGTDRVRFATESTTALPSNPIRSFNRLSDASSECRESRIYAGFHYRFSVNVGAGMGNRIARRVVETQLLRRKGGLR